MQQVCQVFEKKSRLKFKIPKCKIMLMNCKIDGGVVLNGELMEEVKETVYLGTIISKNGERYADMKDRLLKANSVANEIEQICKSTEMSSIRLRYVRLLMLSCLDRKIKYGCALWNITKYKSSSEKLDKIYPNLLKRVLQIPQSTPSSAIQYEFGLNDLSLEILMEKIILASKNLQYDDKRISKQLLKVMIRKKVPGFCSELEEACNVFSISIDELSEKRNIRKFLNKKLVKIQSGELMKRMLISSKLDNTLLNGFCFSGSMMSYLSKLSFLEAKAIFFAKYRMWSTKKNFPGRWINLQCNICGRDDTDEHIFRCPGFGDLVGGVNE